jgi:hypothetical protein
MGHTAWNFEDLSNKRFGKLLVLRPYSKSKSGNIIYECRCDCGNLAYKTKAALSIRKQMCRTCGNKGIVRNSTHGDSKTRLYRTWSGMKSRCSNPHNSKYDLYGGRGIKVCEEWLDFSNFKTWAYANGYNPTLTKEEQSIDRIDSNGNYEPNNCRWADIKTQNKNRRIHNGKQ